MPGPTHIQTIQGDLHIGSNLQVDTSTFFVDSVSNTVGIGTTNPGYALDVAGDINLSGDFYQGGSPFVSSLWTDGNDSLYYRSNVEVGTANLFVDTTTGNVGIGTVSPIARLDINGGAENNTTPALAIRGGLLTESDLYVLNTYNTNTGVGYAAKVIGVNIKNKVETNNTVKLRSNTGGVTSAGAIYLGSDDVNQGIFGVLGGTGTTGSTLAEHLTVKAGGNVGIGTVGPTTKLDVAGVGRFTNNGGSVQLVGADHTYLEYYPDGTSAGRKAYVGYGNADDNNFTISNSAGSGHIILGSGNVGIGTTSPGYKLDVSGTGRFTGTVTAPTFSGNATTASSAATLSGVTINKIFNNMGGNHNSRTDFNAIPDAGAYYVMGSTNGPGVNSASQYYGFTLGLGSDYSPVVNQSGKYGTQIYWGRNVSSPYINIRYLENGSWGSWQKAAAGYADSAGTATNQSGGTVSATTGSFSGSLTASGGITTNAASSRDKLRVWTTNQYNIGMESGVTFGPLNDYAMTFQFNDENDRGFWWGDTAHPKNQGAMALSTRGWLNVAERIKVGGGQADTGGPSYPLHVVGTSYFTNILNIQPSSSGGGQNLFTGYRTGDSYGRAQLVLSSAYSDLVIASSQANNNHGSTLSFTTYNPSNAADYRKFVINQGNWGTRKQFLDFGYGDKVDANPHGYINSTDTVLTLDGINKRVGIKNINPGYTLDVNGNARINRLIPYSSTYASGYNSAAIEVREYNQECATGGTEWARAPRIGFHWCGRVASQIMMDANGTLMAVNNPGNAYENFNAAQVYASTAFYTDGNRSVIRGGSPTLYFRDTDAMSAMIHNNGNLLHILRGGTDTETWTQVNGQWPWVFNLSNNDSTCGGNLYVNGGNVFIGSTSRGLRAVSGNYGTVQTTGGGAGNWEGYSIDGRYVFMSADNNYCGIYNDLDNKWIIYAYRNNYVKLYYNGAEKLSTTTGGVTVTGVMTAVNFSSGAGASFFGMYSGGDSSFDYYDTFISKSCFRDSATNFSIFSDGANRGFSAIDLQFRNIAFYTFGQSGTSTLTSTNINLYRRMFITSGGGVGINDSTPSYRLDVNGNFRAYGIYNSSDRRIKKDIIDVDDASALDTLRLLKPKKYKYIDEKKMDTNEMVWGFIAQEVREVLPYSTNIISDFIPNINEISNVTDSNVITLSMNTSQLIDDSTDLKIKTTANSEYIITLAEIIDEHSIRVNEDLSDLTYSLDENGNVITETVTETLTINEYNAIENDDERNDWTSNIIGYTHTTSNTVISVEQYEALSSNTSDYTELVDKYTKTYETYPGNQVFLIGQRVNDYHTLKKEAIWTVATAALQEVDRQLQAEKAKVATLETQLASVLARLDALENPPS